MRTGWDPSWRCAPLSGYHLRISSGYEGEAGQDNPDNGRAGRRRWIASWLRRSLSRMGNE